MYHVATTNFVIQSGGPHSSYQTLCQHVHRLAVKHGVQIVDSSCQTHGMTIDSSHATRMQLTLAGPVGRMAAFCTEFAIEARKVGLKRRITDTWKPALLEWLEQHTKAKTIGELIKTMSLRELMEIPTSTPSFPGSVIRFLRDEGLVLEGCTDEEMEAALRRLQASLPEDDEEDE